MSYVEWIREIIGHRKIFLVFSSVVARDGSGRILLQHRTDFDSWGLPGGVLEVDEDIETCARRELEEETGLIATGLRLVGVYTHPRYDVVYPNGDQVQQCTFCFAGRTRGGHGRPDGVESSEIAFFEPQATGSLTVPVWYRDMIRDALQGGPPVFTPPFTDGSAVAQWHNIRPLIGDAWLIAVGASAMVVRDDGRILMLRRQRDDGWHFPAGYSRLGENVSHTAVRVTFEETGLRILPERIVGVCTSAAFHETLASGDRLKNVRTLFRASLLAAQARVERDVSVELAWMTPDAILGQAPEQRRPFFEMALSHLNDGYFVA